MTFDPVLTMTFVGFGICIIVMGLHIVTGPSLEEDGPRALMNTMTTMAYMATSILVLWGLSRHPPISTAYTEFVALLASSTFLLFYSVPRLKRILRGERVTY